MVKTHKVAQGVGINLKGRAKKRTLPLISSEEYSLVPDDFIGVTPKVVIKEGSHVKVGESLFVDKKNPEVGFASPVSGTIKAIVRGDRRKFYA